MFGQGNVGDGVRVGLVRGFCGVAGCMGSVCVRACVRCV